MTPATHRDLAPVPAGQDSPLDALRREIDRLDDALHELLMRRADVVARLAASRTKGAGSPLRPGREAQILRRLLARHAGPLPRAALVRLWREILSSSSAMQNRFAVVAFGPPEILALARDHFGSLTPVHGCASPDAALAAVAAGEAQVAVLPLPAEGGAADSAWWAGLDAPRLQVVARLPFLATAPGPEALAVALGAPDPSGADRTLLRLDGRDGAGMDQARLAVALEAAGLPPRSLVLHREGGRLRALAELEGVVEPGDPRLAALPMDHARPLGFYAVPFRGPETEE